MASVTKKLRFAVFMRDGFACRYCGARPPSAVLVVDHVTPRANGGTNDPENLATACRDCNAGKGASMSSAPPPDDGLDQVMPNGRTRREEIETAVGGTIAWWACEYAGDECDMRDGQWPWQGVAREYLPDPASLFRFYEALPMKDVIDACRRTLAKFEHSLREDPRPALLYFYKVCHNMMRGPVQS